MCKLLFLIYVLAKHNRNEGLKNTILGFAGNLSQISPGLVRSSNIIAFLCLDFNVLND